jgi:hypothetical protein
MSSEDPIVIEGRFWLPHDRHRSYGRLEYDMEQGVRIHLVDTNLTQLTDSGPRGPAPADVLFGEALGGQPLTVLGFFPTRWSYQHGPGCAAGDVIDGFGERLIRGAHVRSDQDLHVSTVGSSLHGLREFLTGGDVDGGPLPIPSDPHKAETLSVRRDLLFLPFLRDITTLEQRASRLRAALELAADRLPNRAYETVYRGIFLEPVGNVSDRREAVLKELARLFADKQDNQSPTVKSIEERLVPALVKVLLDPDFARDLDREHPKPDCTVPVTLSHAFRALTSSIAWEIDEDDHRKSVLRRDMQLEILVPDQLVLPIRYNIEGSDPSPVKDSMELHDGHTYLGTLPDKKDGAVAKWMLHFIHLGSRKDPGDVVTIKTQAAFFDKERHDSRPCVTFTVDTHPIDGVSLSLRLPKSKVKTAKPVRQIIAKPHANAVVVKRAPLPIAKDGWITIEFTDLKIGFQYGIYLPDFDLYR